jgi:hypothetical protein
MAASTGFSISSSSSKNCVRRWFSARNFVVPVALEVFDIAAAESRPAPVNHHADVRLFGADEQARKSSRISSLMALRRWAIEGDDRDAVRGQIG